MRRFLAVMCLLLAGPALSLRADFPVSPPAPPPPVVKDGTATVVVEVDDNIKEPRLVVPRKFAGTDKQAKPDANGSRGEAAPFWPTIVAGLALALGFACGGLWLVRQRGHVARGTMASLIAAVTLLSVGAAVTWADRAPARRPPPQLPKSLLGQFDKISVETVEQGDQVRLIVNRQQLATLIAGSLSPLEIKK